MVSLNTNIQYLELSGCIYNASGPLCTTNEELTNLNNSDSCCVLTKSTTLEKRIGNSLPRYYDNQYGSINSMGLPNNGINYYLDISSNITSPYFISVCGLTLDENIDIINNIFNYILKNENEKYLGNISGIEINLSCPNIIGKGQLAYNFIDMYAFLSNIFKTINKFRFVDIKIPLIGVKLPPYFELNHFDEVSDILKQFPIDFITCINSIGNGLIVDPAKEQIVIKPKDGIGGIGGLYVKPTGLSNVYNFYNVFNKKNINIDIIGCGGISSGSDIFEYILCGAKCVQVGTHLYKNGVNIFKELSNELIEIMESKNYKSLNDFYGKIQIL